MAPTLAAQGDNKDLSAVYRRYVDTYTGPASYVTGGDAFAPSDVAMGKVYAIDFGIARNAAGTIYLLSYDLTNQKVIWYVPSTGVQVANGTDLSGFSATFEAIGK